MAAPALGIGDLVNACAFIYDMCMKYKDAPKEFDEIADKAKSTAVVLERINTEAKLRGNLVDRAGPQGYSQLEHHLKGLKSDSEKLKVIVNKYAKIHDEGPGRRMLFTVMESGGLTDLRRRIGLHEQMLEMWYMTLIYGSLRRLEGGQADILGGQANILRAIDAIKKMKPTERRHVQRSLHRGDSKPLERELHRSGMDAEAVISALGTAVDYVDAPPREQVKMESRARSSTVRPFEGDSFRRSSRFEDQPFAFDYGFGDSPSYAKEMPDIRRRRSTGGRKPRHFSVTSDNSDTDEEILFGERKHARESSRRRRRKEGHDADETITRSKFVLHRDPDSSPRPRSSSPHNPYPAPPNSFLDVPGSGGGRGHYHHRRSASQHLPSHDRIVPIYPSDLPPPTRHRSQSRSDPDQRSDTIRIVLPERQRRDSSAHSNHREHERERERDRSRRRSRSMSRTRHDEGDEDVDRRRVVTKMDRIDSVPIPHD